MEGFLTKFMRKAERDPLVPVGCGATLACLLEVGDDGVAPTPAAGASAGAALATPAGPPPKKNLTWSSKLTDVSSDDGSVSSTHPSACCSR